MEDSNEKLKKVLIYMILMVIVLIGVGMWFFARNIVSGSYRVDDALRDVIVFESDTDENNMIDVNSEISYDIATDIDNVLIELVDSIIKSDLHEEFKDLKGISEYMVNDGILPDNILTLRVGDEYKEGFDGIMFNSSLEAICVTEDNYVIFKYGDKMLVVCDYNDIAVENQKVYVGNFYSLLLLNDISFSKEVKGYKVFYMKG